MNTITRKFLLIIYVVLSFSAGCRKETPVEEAEELPGDNISIELTVSSPKDEDEFAYGEEVLIKWSPEDEAVNLDLYRKTDFKVEIARDIKGTGEFVWIVPDNMDASIHYRIRITPRSDPEKAVYSPEFTIKGY